MSTETDLNVTTFSSSAQLILSGIRNAVTPREYGLIADGASHALSTRYGSLGAAQVDYPFVTALTQEIDWAACKAASNAAFGGDLELIGGGSLTDASSFTRVTSNTAANIIIDSTQNWTVDEFVGKTAFRRFGSNGFVDSCPIVSNTATQLTLAGAGLPYGSVSIPTPPAPAEITNGSSYAIGYGEHSSLLSHLNKPLYLPEGIYMFGNDTWRIRDLVGATIRGAGRRATILRGGKTQLAFDGIWYTHLSDFSIEVQATDATAAMEIDGNIPGHPYATRGVQGVTLQNMLIDGGMSTNTLAMCRQGGSGAQGSECTFINVHLSSASFACYYQNGFNALANQFFGGNVQNYSKNGIYVVGGTIAVYGTGFQSTSGYAQIENDGYDINIGDAGAYEGVPIYGCRTESLRFLRNPGGVHTDIRAVVQRPALIGWFALTTYGPLSANGRAIQVVRRLFVTEDDGITGASEPTWPTDGSPVVDGTVTWQEEIFDFINVLDNGGSVDKNSILMNLGRLNCQITDDRTRDTTTSGYVMTTEDALLVDAAGGAKTVYLPRVTKAGRKCTIKKADTSANTVTVMQQDIGFEGAVASVVIAGGSRGWREFHDLGGGFTTRRWFITGSG